MVVALKNGVLLRVFMGYGQAGDSTADNNTKTIEITPKY